MNRSLPKIVEWTNPIVSMIEIVRNHARRVKRWQGGKMPLRWTSAGMVAAEAQVRRIKGLPVELPHLPGGLQSATADQPAANGLDPALQVPTCSLDDPARLTNAPTERLTTTRF